MSKDDRTYLLARCSSLKQERDALRKLVKLLRRFVPKDLQQ